MASQNLQQFVDVTLVKSDVQGSKSTALCNFFLLKFQAMKKGMLTQPLDFST